MLKIAGSALMVPLLALVASPTESPGRSQASAVGALPDAKPMSFDSQQYAVPYSLPPAAMSTNRFVATGTLGFVEAR